MGFIINEVIYKDYEFIIVSGDKGYNVVCDFWRNKGYKAHRINDFTDGTVISRKTITISELRAYLDTEDLLFESKILNLINSVGSTQVLYGNIGKITRDSKRAGIIFHKIKPLFLSQFKKDT